MKHRCIIGCLVSMVSAFGAVHCGSPDRENIEQPDETAANPQSIMFGNVVTNDVVGTPELYVAATTTVCSSTLLSDRWLLTARHCITTDNSIGGKLVNAEQIMAILLDGTTATGIERHGHPTSDVALVKLGQSMLNPVGHPYATPLFLGGAYSLSGPFTSLYCQGWGEVAPGIGGQVLRSGIVTVSGPEDDGVQIVNGPTGQLLGHGDSGLSCLAYLDGHYNIAGVGSYCPTGNIGFPVSCHLVSATWVRPWIEAIVGNAVAVFADPGFKGTAMQLLPAGPTAGGYDTPRLWIGDNVISSWISPSYFSTSLFPNSGYGRPALSSNSTTGTSGNLPSSIDNKTSSIAVTGGVRLFKDGDFANLVMTLRSAGNSDLTGTSADGVISSLTVPAGWTVTMFDNAPGSATSTGWIVRFTEGRYGAIDRDFNDHASYVVVREPASLYADNNWGGASPSLLPGCYDMGQMSIANDTVSSIHVPSGLAVQLFQDAGLRGTSKVFGSSQSSLGTWDGRASGVCVYAQPTAWCGSMHAGEALLSPNLSAGQSTLWSCDHRFYLTMQSDGNLVLYQYQNGTSTALWSSGTWSTTGQVAVLQDDGNFVVYDANNNPLWSSWTFSHGAQTLLVRNDGSMTVGGDGFVLWSSNTCCH